MSEERRDAVRVNGAARALTAATVGDLLVELGYDALQAGLAVAVNGEIVPRAIWRRHGLRAGDDVEVVAAVQGG